MFPLLGSILEEARKSLKHHFYKQWKLKVFLQRSFVIFMVVIIILFIIIKFRTVLQMKNTAILKGVTISLRMRACKQQTCHYVKWIL